MRRIFGIYVSHLLLICFRRQFIKQHEFYGLLCFFQPHLSHASVCVCVNAVAYGMPCRDVVVLTAMRWQMGPFQISISSNPEANWIFFIFIELQNLRVGSSCWLRLTAHPLSPSLLLSVVTVSNNAVNNSICIDCAHAIKFDLIRFDFFTIFACAHLCDNDHDADNLRENAYVKCVSTFEHTEHTTRPK